MGNNPDDKFKQVCNSFKGKPGNWAYDFLTLLIREGHLNYKRAYSIALSQITQDQLNRIKPVFTYSQLDDLYRKSNIVSSIEIIR